MKKLKKVIDERQLMEMYKIEHIGFWIMWTILLISILVQTFLMEASTQQIAPEWIAFMIGNTVTAIGCTKKGIWGYYSNPSMKSYLLISITSACVFGVLFGISLYNRNEYLQDNTKALIIISLISAVFMFGFMFIVMVIYGEMTIRKRNKAEKEYDDDQEK
ncbi:MAG: DUF6773 family protein [Mobilitalea sp.]